MGSYGDPWLYVVATRLPRGGVVGSEQALAAVDQQPRRVGWPRGYPGEVREVPSESSGIVILL